MTIYSGTFYGTQGLYGNSGIWTGTLTLNITVAGNGIVSGSGALTVSYTDTDQYPVTPNLSAADTETVGGGNTQNGIVEFFSLPAGWQSTFVGSLDSTQNTIAGTFDLIYAPTDNDFRASVTLISSTPPPPSPPVITAPRSVVVLHSHASPVAGVSVSDANAGVTITATLADSAGLLTANTGANRGGGTISGAGTTALTIAGTLAQVNADLSTLTDQDSTLSGDSIAVNASDSDGGTAIPVAIAVTEMATPRVIASPQDIINSGSVTDQSSTIGTSLDVLESIFGNVLEPSLQAYLGVGALASSTTKLETLLSSINQGVVVSAFNNTEDAEAFVFNSAYDTTFLLAVGPALALISTWSTAYADYRQNGTFTNQTQIAGIKALAAIASGYAGTIVVAGAGTLFAGGLTFGAAGAGPLIGAVVLGAASAYLINGVLDDLIDGVATSGFHGEAEQAASMGLFGGSPFPSAALAALDSATITSVPASFGNSLPFSVGQPAPQPAWTYDMGTGVFTWLASSSAPLTQALSQLGVTQLAAPLNITASFEFRVG